MSKASWKGKPVVSLSRLLLGCPSSGTHGDEVPVPKRGALNRGSAFAWSKCEAATAPHSTGTHCSAGHPQGTPRHADCRTPVPRAASKHSSRQYPPHPIPLPAVSPRRSPSTAERAGPAVPLPCRGLQVPRSGRPSPAAAGAADTNPRRKAPAQSRGWRKSRGCSRSADRGCPAPRPAGSALGAASRTRAALALPRSSPRSTPSFPRRPGPPASPAAAAAAAETRRRKRAPRSALPVTEQPPPPLPPPRLRSADAAAAQARQRREWRAPSGGGGAAEGGGAGSAGERPRSAPPSTEETRFLCCSKGLHPEGGWALEGSPGKWSQH